MKTPPNALKICRMLQRSGFQSYIVGGAVRDSLLGREVHDWDIASDARPEQVVSLFRHVIKTGMKHGTVTVMMSDEAYEVTTFRGDGTYSDGRRPDSVQFLDTIEEDLARRDLTVNAIAYDPLRNLYVDPWGGMKDLSARTLRAVGNPLQRFSEDALRMLRAARFSATLGFTIEESTLKAISILRSLEGVSPERIRDEIMKAMTAESPSRAFRVMVDTGILAKILPTFMPMVGCTQNKYHEFDVWEHTLRVVDACPPSDPILRVAALLHDVGKPASKGSHPVTGDATFYDHENIGAELSQEILESLRFSTDEINRVTHLVRHHFVRYETDWSSPTLRRWIRKVGLEHIPSLVTLARADIAGKGSANTPLEVSVVDHLEDRVRNMKDTEVIPTSTSVLAINGKDVMEELGISPGPVVGKVLNKLLEIVTDNPDLNTRESLLKILSGIKGTVQLFVSAGENLMKVLEEKEP